MSINIIGPIASGKSTISIELSRYLNFPRISFDHIKHYYFYKYGFDSAKAHSLENKSYIEYIHYIKEYEILATKNVINEFKSHIIDFGGGILWSRNVNEKQQIIESLNSNYSFLLIPCNNNEKNIEILHNRLLNRFQDIGIHLNMFSKNEYAINRRLLNEYILDSIAFLKDDKIKVIFTENKSIKDITIEIINDISKLNTKEAIGAISYLQREV